MNVVHLLFAVMYGASVVASLSVGALLLQYRENPGAVPLVMAAFAVTFWSGPLFVATLTGHYPLSESMARLTYLGVGLVIMWTFVFALEYSGREHLVNRRTIALLSIEPIVLITLVFTNPGNVFFVDLYHDPTIPSGVGIEYGVAFWIHIAYSCLLLTLATLMMIELLYTSKSMYRGQAAALFGGVAIPWIGNGLLHLGVVEGDVTPAGFILSSSLFALAVVRYQLVDLVPIARDSVLDTISDAIVVIDREERVVDLNPTARDLFDVDEDWVVGTELSLVIDEPPLVEQCRSLIETPTGSMTEATSDDRHYEIRARPIDDSQNRHVGWVFVIADVTERTERERTLQQQNERLDQFASLVSHDLRNPLHVANGYVDIACQTGDLEYLDEVEQSHQRMETIIEDVLTLTREGKGVADPEPVAVDRTAREAWEHVDTRGAQLHVEADEPVMADRDRLARLLENLYRNSIEHGPETTPEELTITVSTERDDQGDTARILVEDDGVGIPEDRREQVLEHGYTTEEEGTGLGLSIVSQIAEAHGWTASVSESDTGGARFVLDGAELVETRSTGLPSESSHPSWPSPSS